MRGVERGSAELKEMVPPVFFFSERIGYGWGCKGEEWETHEKGEQVSRYQY